MQGLRQRLSDTEAQLQQERQDHGATRAEQATLTSALDRKAAALQNAEAEKDRLSVSLKHAEEMVKELTHAKLEGTAQDAAARKAQHVNEVCSQLLHLYTCIHSYRSTSSSLLT